MNILIHKIPIFQGPGTSTSNTLFILISIISSIAYGQLVILTPGPASSRCATQRGNTMSCEVPGTHLCSEPHNPLSTQLADGLALLCVGSFNLLLDIH